MKRSPRIDQIVRDIEAVTRFALATPTLGVEAQARRVRLDVDMDALVEVIDAINRWAAHDVDRELTREEATVVAAQYRIDAHLDALYARHAEIVARLRADGGRAA